MADNTSWRKQLPKAQLIRFEWWSSFPMWGCRRIANARMIHLGPLMVMIRAPYLEHAARAHYPHLFTRQEAAE